MILTCSMSVRKCCVSLHKPTLSPMGGRMTADVSSLDIYLANEMLCILRNLSPGGQLGLVTAKSMFRCYLTDTCLILSPPSTRLSHVWLLYEWDLDVKHTVDACWIHDCNGQNSTYCNNRSVTVIKTHSPWSSSVAKVWQFPSNIHPSVFWLFWIFCFSESCLMLYSHGRCQCALLSQIFK